MAESERADELERRVVERLGGLTEADFRTSAPPPSVWQGIAAGLVAPPAPQQVASRRIRPVLAAIGVAAAVAVAALGFAVNRRDDTVTLARAELSSVGLPGAPSGRTAEASVVDRTDRRVLRLDLASTRPASGEYLELWLITPDISGMVSLGAARPDGTYDLPPGLEVGDYPVVDVSSEPYDGDPAHSGVSLLRGRLESVS